MDDIETTEQSSDETAAVADEEQATEQAAAQSDKPKAEAHSAKAEEAEGDGEGNELSEEEKRLEKDYQDLIRNYKLEGIDPEKALRLAAKHFWENKRSGSAAVKERDKLQTKIEALQDELDRVRAAREAEDEHKENEKPVEVKFEQFPELGRLQTKITKYEERQKVCIKEMGELAQQANSLKTKIARAEALVDAASDAVEKAERTREYEAVVDRYNGLVSRWEFAADRKDTIEEQLEDAKFQLDHGKKQAEALLKEHQSRERARREAERAANVETNKEFELTVASERSRFGIPEEKAKKFDRLVKSEVLQRLREVVLEEGEGAGGLDIAEVTKEVSEELASEWTQGKVSTPDKPHVNPRRVTTDLPAVSSKPKRPLLTQEDYDAEARRAKEEARRIMPG